MKKLILSAAAIAIAAAMSACGGNDSGSASYENTYSETTSTGRRTISDTTITLGDWVGTYSGEVDGEGYLDGQGTWVSDYLSDYPDQTVVISGLWLEGEIYNGTLEWYYKNASMGKVGIIKGEMNQEDFAAIDSNIADAVSREEWDDTVDDIKEIGGYIGDFIDWYDSIS